MDTSGEYIKMCAAAAEIQKQRPDNAQGEFVYYQEDEVAVQQCDDTPGFDVSPDAYRDIWLPRQDQLQEMLSEKLWSQWDALDQYIHGLRYPLGLVSMEQLWLALVMKEKYGKLWNGKEWV